jgi:hypothetical protein
MADQGQYTGPRLGDAAIRTGTPPSFTRFSCLSVPFIKTSFPGPGKIVPFVSKFSAMKKLIVGIVLLSGVTAVAFASFSNKKKDKAAKEKKTEKKKRDCKKTCMFS